MNKNIKISLLIFSFLILSTGAVLTVNAASPDTETANRFNMNFVNPENRQENREAKQNRRAENDENFEAIKNAVESGDYETWKELTVNRPVSENITADNFSKLKEMHELRQNGEFEEARTIAEELGFKHLGPNNMKGMRGQGMRDGTCRLNE